MVGSAIIWGGGVSAEGEVGVIPLLLLLVLAREEE